MRSIRRDDVPPTVEGDGIEVRSTAIGGDQSVTFVRMAAGTDLRPLLKGLPYNFCPCPHWGYMLSGSLRMRTSEGDYTYRAGDAFFWAPGHLPEALEDCEYVDFSPSLQCNKVLEHMTAAGDDAGSQPA
ncbi:MAG TPA: hypothetical protein VNT54_13500 [Solirubrobacteraceae bacterium]|nr:hypothetical protein [Solirubrobacteraceae bacterium]